MPIYLAAPFNSQSTPKTAVDGVATVVKVNAPGCFAASLANRPKVKLTLGHRGKTLCRVEPFETASGLWFKYDGELPADFSGFSIRYKPLRWRHIGPSAILLLEARLKHIALLTSPNEPAHPITRTARYKEPSK